MMEVEKTVLDNGPNGCDNDPEVPIKRRRFVVSQEATKGGKRCSIEHGKEESAACKKVDCVGEWKWEDIACKDYGSGLQNKKVFSITQNAEWGGNECKYPDGNIKYGPCTKVEIAGTLKKGSELTASPTNFAPYVRFKNSFGIGSKTENNL